jgi:hypothetical protein
MKTVTLVLALLAAPTALADPPTPPPKPTSWEFLGLYYVGEGAGRGSVNDVIDPDSVHRDGDIVYVHVGRDFLQLDGRWVPGQGYVIIGYKVDCKYHTYNEHWIEPSTLLGVAMDGENNRWTPIESDGETALVEKKLCTPKKLPR